MAAAQRRQAIERAEEREIWGMEGRDEPKEAKLARDAERQALMEEEAEAMGAIAAGRILVGMMGHPNVGKSSLLNTLFGEKKASVKETPGHTKILQTMIYDERTCLYDSPGIVFPRLDVTREEQIIGQLIPTAQVREPFSAVRCLAEYAHPSLPEQLKLKPYKEVDRAVLAMEPSDPRFFDVEDGMAPPWSPLAICAKYAMLRGFYKSGKQTDDIQAGMSILRRNLECQCPWWVDPPKGDPVRRVLDDHLDEDVKEDFALFDTDSEEEGEAVAEVSSEAAKAFEDKFEEIDAQRGYISVSDDEYESEGTNEPEWRDFRKKKLKKPVQEGEVETLSGQTGDFDDGFWDAKIPQGMAAVKE